MRAAITDIDALSAVGVLQLHAYLKSQGWQRGDDLGDRGVVYCWSSGTEIFAPGTTVLGDYAESVAAAVRTISRVEDRSEFEVLRDVVSSDHDLIRIRAPEAEDDGSISINAGVDLFRQSREALLAVACATVDPRRAYRTGGNKEASEYLEKVRMGQTEQGSFVVTLLSPVSPALAEAAQPTFWTEISEDPFERQVTRTFSKAVQAVQDAVSDVGRGEDIEAFERAVKSGVSANLCEALSSLIADGEGLDVSLSWARTRPAPEKLTRTRFSASDIGVLSEAARLLREKEPRPNERLEGFVTRLARDEGATEGIVTIKAVLDGSFTSVRVDLSQTLYGRAVEAHGARRRISLDGDLERQGQRWKLVSPRHLEIISDDENEESEEEPIENGTSN